VARIAKLGNNNKYLVGSLTRQLNILPARHLHHWGGSSTVQPCLKRLLAQLILAYSERAFQIIAKVPAFNPALWCGRPGGRGSHCCRGSQAQNQPNYQNQASLFPATKLHPYVPSFYSCIEESSHILLRWLYNSHNTAIAVRKPVQHDYAVKPPFTGEKIKTAPAMQNGVGNS
jgi:hypothetical protein